MQKQPAQHRAGHPQLRGIVQAVPTVANCDSEPGVGWSNSRWAAVLPECDGLDDAVAVPRPGTALESLQFQLRGQLVVRTDVLHGLHTGPAGLRCDIELSDYEHEASNPDV